MPRNIVAFLAYVRVRQLEAALRRAARSRGLSTVAYGNSSPVGSMRQEFAIIDLVMSVDKELRLGLDSEAASMARTLVMGCRA